METTPERIPAGWYPDPSGLPQLRWWNNHAWTEDVSDIEAPTDATRVDSEPAPVDEVVATPIASPVDPAASSPLVAAPLAETPRVTTPPAATPLASTVTEAAAASTIVAPPLGLDAAFDAAFAEEMAISAAFGLVEDAPTLRDAFTSAFAASH